MKTIYYRRVFMLKDQPTYDTVLNIFSHIEEIQYIVGLGYKIRLEILPIPSFTSQTWQATFHITDTLFTTLHLKYFDSAIRFTEPVSGLDICGSNIR